MFYKIGPRLDAPAIPINPESLSWHDTLSQFVGSEKSGNIIFIILININFCHSHQRSVSDKLIFMFGLVSRGNRIKEIVVLKMNKICTSRRQKMIITLLL